jgi:P-type Ca2+ transporter type 2C
MKYYLDPVENHIADFKTKSSGLEAQEVLERQQRYGKNILPQQKSRTLLIIFAAQFLNPLIYILIAAAVVAVIVQDFTDAFFILVVLLLNAIIGTVQEYGAEKSAMALKNMASSKNIVLRDGKQVLISAEELVPGDIVLLESGHKVPADIRLISTHGLEIDESLLTGESEPVTKNHDAIIEDGASLGDQFNMLFMGALVTKGRAKGLVVTTADKTQLGKIAGTLQSEQQVKPPLIIRMEAFTKKIALVLLVVIVLMAIYSLYQGQSWYEVLSFSVALAVSAIPEGLPVALTIALAIASQRMAKRNVLVRRLPAVEALGSCTFIATDKTGTLTVNQMTLRKVLIGKSRLYELTGSGLDPAGDVLYDSEQVDEKNKEILTPMIYPVVLCNEAELSQKDDRWHGVGDAVDLAFLTFAHKAGFNPTDLKQRFSLKQSIPFESENQYAATLHYDHERSCGLLSVKGALEKLLPLCVSTLDENNNQVDLNRDDFLEMTKVFAQQGLRVLAVASKEIDLKEHDKPSREAILQELSKLQLIGLTGMIDPLRPETIEAIESCKSAGVMVSMVTGDHPVTSLAIARDLGLAKSEDEVVTGPELKNYTDEQRVNKILHARVFARVEPQQKWEIVQTLMSHGHFVAVTGDGVNDAPALKTAHVGIAMGENGTDIAKESSDLILTDDRFASIVSGIEEGRVAFANIRKVIYLLISTGLAEIVMIFLSLIFQTPLPLTAVQLLWLNLVTNGIQHIGLTLEPKEGDELQRPPRDPQEPIFDRLMLERIFLSSFTMGVIAFWQFKSSLDLGLSVESARNMTLLLMVLFENVMVGNSRSELKSAFSMGIFRNPVLLIGTLMAQLIHIWAMHSSFMSDVLGLEKVSLQAWSVLLVEAMSVLLIIEIYKLFRRAYKLKRHA